MIDGNTYAVVKVSDELARLIHDGKAELQKNGYEGPLWACMHPEYAVRIGAVDGMELDGVTVRVDRYCPAESVFMMQADPLAWYRENGIKVSNA
jgi:hypothetical protein